MINVNDSFVKLNTLSSQNFSVIGSTQFYFGNAKDKTSELIPKLIPFGKAVLFCDESDYDIKARHIEEALSEKGIKVVLFFNPSYQEQPNIPEDARAIITFNNEYFNLAGKIATKRNLFSLFIITEFNFDNILNTFFEVEEGGKRQKIRLDFDRRILFDTEIIFKDEKGSAEEFAFVMSKLMALVDYRIFGILTETPTNRNAYNLIKGAVEETYSLFSGEREEYLLSLMENAIKIRLADAITLGKFLQNSSADICAKLCRDKNSTLFYAKRIAKIYSLAFSREFDGVEVPDYLARVEELLKVESAREMDISKWIIFQSRLCAKKQKEIDLIKERLFVETSSYLKIFEQVEKTYLALGGDRVPINSEFIKLSGDFFEVFNGMTIVRDCGVGEFL